MYNVNASRIDATVTTKHAFTSLTKLRLSISDNTRLLQNPSSTEASSLSSLLQCTAPTLQFLALTFSWENHRDYTRHTPSLGPIFAKSTPESSAPVPLVFPRLLQLILRHISMETSNLVDFVRHQPLLQNACFESFLISTPNTTWNDVEIALPRSVEGWQVRNVSLRKRSRTDQCCTWNPIVETLNPETGWQWDVHDFLRHHQLQGTEESETARFEFLKARNRFGTTKFVPLLEQRLD